MYTYVARMKKIRWFNTYRLCKHLLIKYIFIYEFELQIYKYGEPLILF